MPTTTSSGYEVSSSDGSYTIKVVRSFTFEPGEGDFNPYHRMTADVVDNNTGETKNIIDVYAPYDAFEDPLFKFSSDNKLLIYSTPGLDSSSSLYRSYSYIDLEAMAGVAITGDLYESQYALNKIDFTEDGSKITYILKRYDGAVQDGVAYIATVPQLTAPTATGAGIVAGDGTLTVGQTVTLSIGLLAVDEVTHPESITLGLNTGGVARYDATASVAGQTLVFRYTVQPDQSVSDLAVTALNLNGAVLTGAGGRSVVTDGPLLNIAGRLVIDGYAGTEADETFLGRSGVQTFRGGAGDDVYHVDDPGDRVFENLIEGNDTVTAKVSYTLIAGQEIETLQLAPSTGHANLDLTGNVFDQVLRGNAGNNRLDGKEGADTLIGGAGDDIYRVDSGADRIVEAVGEGNDTLFTSVHYRLTAGAEIETLRLLGGAWRLTGNAFAQTLLGNDSVNLLEGGGGADRMQGFGGDDTYAVDDAGDRVFEVKGAGYDTIVSTVSYALLSGQEIETLQLASSTGSAGLKLIGNPFANTLRGNNGANLLDGGAGVDQLYGKGGDDTYAVDQPGDQVFEARGGGNDAVVATASYALAAGQEIETLQLARSTGERTLNLTGNEFANTLRGNAGANLLDGRGGADLMVGGAGNDTYAVDSSQDRIVEAKGGGTDTVVATVGYTLAAGEEIETLQLARSTGSAALNLNGNAFANTLRGNDGSNVLDGRGGADVLTGKAGPDAFVFSTALGAGNVDRITDFAPVEDGLRLAGSVFTALDAGPLKGAAFKDIGVAGARIDADDRILYDRNSGVLAYDADGSGKAAGIVFAVLDNRAALTHDDFFVV